jgi:nicotinate-nucleotide adenylyltransferase
MGSRGFISRPESVGNTSIQSASWDAGIPISPGPCDWSPRQDRILGLVRTGILGGTFDPIHIAHLHAGETALHAAELDRVLFMPAGDPWQKSDDRRITPAKTRVEMTRLAIAGKAEFEIDLREVHRDGPTYTIDTLLSFPDSEDLHLILGSDAAIGLPTWHRWEEVVERSRILVVPRPGYTMSEVTKGLPNAVALDMATLDISSTAIREMASEGRPYRYLVPAEVHELIEREGIYTQSPSGDMVRSAQDQEEAQ